MTMEARPSPRALVPYQEPEPILTLPERIRRFLQPRTSPARVPALSSGNVGSVSFVNNDVALARPGGSATYRAMAATPWVFSAIGIRKDQVSSADWDILPYDNTKKHSVRLQQRIHDLFDQPSMKLDSFQSFAATVVDDLLTLDAGIVEKVRYPDRSIAELWPVRGEWISVDERWDGSDPEKPRYYFIPDGTIRARFNNEDMLYMIANPRANSAVGLSPMAVLQTVIDSELQAMEYNRRMVMGAPPDGVLNIGDDAPKEKVDETSSFFNSKIFGQSSMAVIGGFKNPGYIPFNKSQREMQFREWQDLLIRCIAVTLKMSPQDLGITFDVNRSTSETQSQNTEDRGLRPLMSLIQKYFTREIVWDESFGGKDNNLQFVFKSLNLNETLQKANINRVAMPGVPWKSPNEARVTDGRPPIGDPEDEENIFNHLLTNTPKGMLDLTADKYVGEEQLAKIAADAQVSVAEAQGAIDATKADKAAQNAKEVAAVTPAPVVAAKPATKGLVFDEPAPPPVSIILPETYDVTVQHPFDPSELITAIKDIRITVPVVPAPVVNVPAPIVNLPAPIVTVTSDMEPVVKAIRDGFAVTTEREVTQTDAQGRPTEIVMRRGTATVRQTIKRDKTGRVTKTKDVTEVDGGA